MKGLVCLFTLRYVFMDSCDIPNLGYKDWRIVESDGKYGIEDEAQNLICPIKYLQIYKFYSGLAILKYKKKVASKVRWGVINEKAEIVIFPEEYEEIKILSSKLIAFKEKLNKCEEKWELDNNGKIRKVKVKTIEYRWGIISSSGSTICTAKYDSCPECIRDNEFWIAPINGYFTLINAEGKQLCRAKYDIIEADVMEPDFFYAYRNHCQYRMNKKGREIKKNRCKMYS